MIGRLKDSGADPSPRIRSTMNERSIVLVQDGTFIGMETISDSGDAAI
jgi:hypothetical protein